MHIAFNSTSQKAQASKEKLLSAFNRVIDSGVFLNGPENEKLASNLHNFLNLDSKLYTPTSIVATASGHDALVLAIRSLNLEKDDEVLVPVNSYPTALAAACAGVTVRFMDCNESGQTDKREIDKRITNKTKALVLVHLYGNVSDDLSVIASEYRSSRASTLLPRTPIRGPVTLIEDCAQAFGTTVNGQAVGTFGDISCFSFYPTKNLGTLGEGGAVVAKNPERATYIRKLATYGENERYKSDVISGHSRLPELQAAVLNEYLSNFEEVKQKRQKVFSWYLDALRAKSLRVRPLINRELVEKGDVVPHLFVLATDRRDGLQKYLADNSIETHIHYPHPAHLVPAFRDLSYRAGDFPIAERLSKEILSLPFHEYLTKNEVEEVVRAIERFYQ